MTKLESIIDSFLIVACGNVDDVRLDVHEFGDHATQRSDIDDDTFLSYFDDGDSTLRTYFDDDTVYTDATGATSLYTGHSPNQDIERAIYTLKKYADRLGVRGEDILRTPELLQGIREEQRKQPRENAERSKWLDILRIVACNQSTARTGDWQHLMESIDDSTYISENDDYSYYSYGNNDYSCASTSISKTDTRYLLAKQRAAAGRARNATSPFTKPDSARDKLQTINESRSDGTDDTWFLYAAKFD